MMTSRERWVAALRLQPVDRLPFYPKLEHGYLPPQQPHFRQMGFNGLHDWIGSDNNIWVPNGAKEVRRRTSVERAEASGVFRTVYRVGSASTELVEQFEETSQATHPVRYPVRSLADIELMTEVFEDCVVEEDSAALERVCARVSSIGEHASTFTGIGESPLMEWVEVLAGVENAHYLLADYPQAVARLLAAMHRVLLRKVEIVADKNPADMLYLFDNVSTTLVSPRQYRQYWMPYIREYAAVTNSAHRFLVLHMCGHLKALLIDLSTLPVSAFEAFTSPPLGNTSLLDGRTACPDKCLIGGTNATLWLRPAAEIISKIEEDLNALPHHRGLVLTSGGVMPPACTPETIKTVFEWVRSYPVRV